MGIFVCVATRYSKGQRNDPKRSLDHIYIYVGVYNNLMIYGDNTYMVYSYGDIYVYIQYIYIYYVFLLLQKTTQCSSNI